MAKAPPRARTTGTTGAVSGRPLRPGPPVLRLLAPVFFFLPLALFLIGIRSAPIENHSPVHFPALALKWATVGKLNSYFTGNLPLRDTAIRNNERLSNSVFGQPATFGPSDTSTATAAAPGVGASTTSAGKTSTGAEAAAPHQTQQQSFLQLPPPAPEPNESSNNEVTVGQGGWLYLTGEFYKECERGQAPATVVADLSRLQQILAQSGRSLVFTLAPDKSTAEPQYLPGSYPLQSCVSASKQQTYSLLDGAAIPGYIDMKGLIAARQSADGRPYYMRQDTHWNGLADAAFAEKTAQLLDPKLMAGVVNSERVSSYTGDLTILLGSPHQDKTIFDVLSRPGVNVTQVNTTLSPGITRAETHATSTGAPLVSGRALLVGDSFSEVVRPNLAPFFSDLLAVRGSDFAEAPKTMFDAIQSSKTVVLVWNERYFTDPNYSVMWSPEFLNKLQTSLGHV